jgi:hypothetical protein
MTEPARVVSSATGSIAAKLALATGPTAPKAIASDGRA